MDKLVSGPINIAHLRSPDNKKNVYIFFDVHAEKEKQTKCDTDSKDIVEFFNEIFIKAKKTIDFMVEINPSHIVEENSEIGEDFGYLDTIRAFTIKHFNITEDGTTVIKSKEYPNVRIHYVDIRDTFLSLVDRETVSRWVYDEKYIYDYTTKYNFRALKRNVNYIVERIKDVQDLFYGKNKTKKINMLKLYSNHKNGKYYKIKKKEHEIILKYILTKIQSRISNVKLIDVVEFMANKELLPTLKKIVKIQKALNNCERSNDFFELSYNFYDAIIDYSVPLMDMYTIRRIVDKNYIDNVFLYVGADHACNDIMILINMLNYDLVNIAKHSENSLEELKRKIRNTMDYKIVREYIAKDIHQCSNHTSFDFSNI